MEEAAAVSGMPGMWPAAADAHFSPALGIRRFDVSLLDDDLSSSESEAEAEDLLSSHEDLLSQCPTLEILPRRQPLGPICRKSRASPSVTLDGPLFELDGPSDCMSPNAGSRRRRRRDRSFVSKYFLSDSSSSLPSSMPSSTATSVAATSAGSSPVCQPRSPSLSESLPLECSFLTSSLERLLSEPLPGPTDAAGMLLAAPRQIGIRPSPLASSTPALGSSSISINLGSAAAATAVAAQAASGGGSPDSLSQGLASRPSRAERGRSGRRHRRDTGVSIRALRIVDAARLGPWPPAAFSKLCNCLKDAPANMIDVRLSLRPGPARTSELLIQSSALRGGGTAFKISELCVETLGGNLLLRATRSNMNAGGADHSAIRHIARLLV